MKLFRRLFPLLFALMLGSSVAASISIEFHFGAVDVPTGSLGVLAVDTGSDGFEAPALTPGVPLTVGETLGLNDVVVAVFSNANLPEWTGRRGFASHFAEIDYTSLGLEEGQSWILYVFPERGEDDPVRTGEPHVAFRPSDLSGLSANSSMGFELPADGGAYLLAMLDPTAGGTADLSGVDIAPADLVGGAGDLQRDLSPTARHTYYFEMTQPGFLSISANGAEGLRGELYHRDGQLVASSNGTLPFWFEQELEAGFHTLVLYRDDTGSGDISYDVEIASEWVRFVRPAIAIGSKFNNLRTTGEYSSAGAVVRLISKKARKVNGLATVANRGERPESLAVTATRGTKLIKVRYLSAQGNITSGVTAGTYRTPALASGSAPVWVQAKFAPKKKKFLGAKARRLKAKQKKFTSLITARSVSDATLSDGGRWRLRVK